MALFAKPRLIQLLEVASRAELLRRRRQVRGAALRAGSGAGAALFALLMLLGLHMAAWAALAGPLGPVGAALAVVALDGVLVLVLGGLGARGRADPAAAEAIVVRDAALRGAQRELQTFGGLLRTPMGDTTAPPSRRRVRVYPP